MLLPSPVETLAQQLRVLMDESDQRMSAGLTDVRDLT